MTIGKGAKLIRSKSKNKHSELIKLYEKAKDLGFEIKTNDSRDI